MSDDMKDKSKRSSTTNYSSTYSRHNCSIPE